MAREMKVYGWVPFQKGKQVRAIVAAQSFAAASRASEAANLGKIRREYVSVTGNQDELEVALSDPGTVFVTSLNYPRDDYKPTIDSATASDPNRASKP